MIVPSPAHTPTRRTAALVAAHRGAGVARRRVRMGRSRPPIATELAYAAAIAERLDLRSAVRPLVAALPDIVASATRERGDGVERDDAPTGRRIRDQVERMRATVETRASTNALESLADRYGQRVASLQRSQLQRQARAQLGIDVHPTDARLPNMVSAFAQRNAQLIQNLGRRSVDDIARIVQNAYQAGVRAEAIQQDIYDRIEVSERHAALIARDQIGSLNGQVTAMRHRELGVRSFVWTTMGDDRVRPEHEALNRQTFSYDDPPDEGLPGEPIACRCTQTPSFEHILDVLEGGGDEEGPPNRIEPPASLSRPNRIAAPSRSPVVPST